MRIFNRAIKIMLLTNSFVLFAAAMLAPIYALFVEELGGSLLDASITAGVLALSAGITVLLAGKYSDKMKENELVMVLGYVIIGIGFLFYMLVNSIFTLLLIQLLIGLGEAIYLPAFDAVYSKHLDKSLSGRQWGAWESANYFTKALGAVAGGFIVTKFSFNVLFLIMALLCFGSAIYIYQLPRKVL